MARPVCTAGSRRPCAPIDWHASLSAVLHATLQSPMPADRRCPTGCGTTATGTTSGSRSARGAAPAFHTRHPPSLPPVPRRSTPRPRPGTPDLELPIGHQLPGAAREAHYQEGVAAVRGATSAGGDAAASATTVRRARAPASATPAGRPPRPPPRPAPRVPPHFVPLAVTRRSPPQPPPPLPRRTVGSGGGRPTRRRGPPPLPPRRPAVRSATSAGGAPGGGASACALPVTAGRRDTATPVLHTNARPAPPEAHPQPVSVRCPVRV